MDNPGPFPSDLPAYQELQEEALHLIQQMRMPALATDFSSDQGYLNTFFEQERQKLHGFFPLQPLCSRKICGLLLVREDQILLRMRPAANGNLGYVAPASHISQDELAEEAARRILAEKLHLDTVQQLGQVCQRETYNACRRTLEVQRHTWYLLRATLFPEQATAFDELAAAPSQNWQRRKVSAPNTAWHWYSLKEVQQFVNRTKQLQSGAISMQEYVRSPGLQGKTWQNWLMELLSP